MAHMELNDILEELCKMTSETEIVEFKEAKTILIFKV